jgi:hypothetical protein
MLTARGDKAVDQELAEIAQKYLDIDTLETQNSDSLDFHDLSVANLKEALEEAYLAGKRAGVHSCY